MKNRVGFVWLRRFSLLVANSAMVAGLVGCKTRGLHESAIKDTGSSSALVPYDDFCSSNAPATASSKARSEDEPVQFWNRKTIEDEIGQWHNMVLAGSSAPALKELFTGKRPKEASPRFRASSVLVSYATAYKEMTAERDKARCDPGSKMWSRDRHVNMINHALADLMTRNLINISKNCLLDGAQSKGYGLKPENGLWEFCDLYFDAAGAFRGQTNSMTVAMSSTMIYLTSHISAALSALPFMDRLWVRTEYERKGNDSQWEQRINFIEKEYVNPYNAFNAFLAVNLDTVSKALYRDPNDKSEKYALLCGKNMEEISSTIENKLPTFTRLIDLVFKRIRSQSFALGIKMARSIAASDLETKAKISKILGGTSALPEIHPFLKAVSLDGGAGYYYEIRQMAPVFDEHLFEFHSILEARELTWRYRFLVESMSARQFFKSLGAITYDQGFNDNVKTNQSIVAKTLQCALTLAADISQIWRGDQVLLRSFANKATTAGLIDPTAAWKAEYAQIRSESRKGVKLENQSESSSASCDLLEE
jgi:hypothetical protein